MTLPGVKPQGLYQWRRPTFWLYGVVEPLTGEHFFQVYDQLNGRAFQDFIEAFAARYPDAVLVVQMDQAAAHRANTMNWPPNVVPVFQPPYTPEVNPIERLWQHLRAALAWQSFETLEALRQKLQAVLSQMTAGAIRSLTGWSFITEPLLNLSSN